MVGPRDEEKVKRSRRTYGIVEDFAERFNSRGLALTGNANYVSVRNPLSGSLYPAPIADVAGKLVAEFFRRRDKVDNSIQNYENRHDNESLQEYWNDSKALHSLVDDFQEVIQQARSRNIIDEQKEYEQLRQKNAELEARVGQLSRDLKKCKDEFDAYKRTVKPLGGRRNPEYGDVVHG